ncbi:MAG: ABC transporter permease subunit [Xanthomonadaceae bacterium]|nr:ABC transporter permease subunit [Rhodospirillaceae bacterium]NIA17767.1 ABC transporter permease subunit [Xanthomonadaceae bacterium]
MNNIYTIFRKEMANYFNSPIAYIFVAVFLISSTWLFFQNFFLNGQATMRGYFYFLPWIFLFLAPAISMRSFAEERRSGTLELLLTLPVKDWEVVLGKFLSNVIFITITILLSITVPISINILGQIDMGTVIGGYLGAILLASSYLSLGLFVSSFTKNQIVAFIISIAGLFFLFILGANFVLNVIPTFLVPIFSFLGLGTHFDNITKGVVDTRDLIYYFSFIFLFLWLTVRSIESRNWK